MITAQEALNFQPQKAGMNGYRAIEVDQFAATVAETLDFQEKKIRDLQNKIVELKQNETIIQTTLVNAQKLAMQITEESKATAQQLIDDAAAKAASELAEAEHQAQLIVSEATAKAHNLADETNAIAARLDNEARESAAKIIAEAKAEAEQIKAETAAEIARENKVLDAVKTEVSKFRTDVLNMYKAQVTLIRDLPDMMPDEPVYIEPASVEPENSAVIVAEPEIAEEPSTEGAGVDLLKLMSDMKENERAAADAVDEVASMTDAPIEGQVTLLDIAAEDDENVEGGVSLQFNANDIAPDDEATDEDDIPVIPVIKREGGFVINIDDDDE